MPWGKTWQSAGNGKGRSTSFSLPFSTSTTDIITYHNPVNHRAPGDGLKPSPQERQRKTKLASVKATLKRKGRSKHFDGWLHRWFEAPQKVSNPGIINFKTNSGKLIHFKEKRKELEPQGRLKAGGNMRGFFRDHSKQSKNEAIFKKLRWKTAIRSYHCFKNLGVHTTLPVGPSRA